MSTVVTTLPQSKIGSEVPIFASSLKEGAKGAVQFFTRFLNDIAVREARDF